jgi:hypothetical protein
VLHPSNAGQHGYYGYDGRYNPPNIQQPFPIQQNNMNPYIAYSREAQQNVYRRKQNVIGGVDTKLPKITGQRNEVNGSQQQI